MSDQNGVKSNNIDPASLLDDFIANRNGSTVRVPVEAAATQLLSTGPFQLLTNASKLFPSFAALTVAGISDMTPWVYADPNPAKNGIYRPVAGVWTWSLPLPYSFIKAVNTGAGTGSNIQATTPIPVSEMTLIILPIAEINGPGPVTVSFNGAAPLTVKSNSGNDIAEGGLVPPMKVTGVISGSEFQIVSDQVAAAVVAAAEAWAQDARASATSAAGSAVLSGKYAVNPEDAEVIAGSGIFSAFHWYRKTFALFNAVAAGFVGMIHAASAKVDIADNDEFAIADSADGWGLKKVLASTVFGYVAKTLGLDFFTGFVPEYVSATAFRVGVGKGCFGGKKLATIAAIDCDLSELFGTGNGCLDAGAVQANKTYFVYAIRKTADGSTKFLASLFLNSSGNIAVPAGWEILPGSRVGVVLTNGSAQIVKFIQVGNSVRVSETLWFTANSNLSALAIPANIPIGISVDVWVGIDTRVAAPGQDITAFCGPADQVSMVLQPSPSVRVRSRSGNDYPDQSQSVGKCRSNAVGQLFRLVSASSTACAADFFTSGWDDYSCRRLWA